MPSGKAHDLITILATPPTALVVLTVTNDWRTTFVVACATLFSGFMFGPDLDTHSQQYTRWSIFRFLWLPYKVVFRHRSRWSHGILFGTLIRVLYFAGVLLLLAAVALYFRAMLLAGAPPSVEEYAAAWSVVKAAVEQSLGDGATWWMLAGLWWGAATHTIADVVWSMMRKGTEIF